MKVRKASLFTLAAALGLGLTSGAWGHATKNRVSLDRYQASSSPESITEVITFEKPTMIPGITLREGSYTFEAAPSSSTVPVLDANGEQVATAETRPAEFYNPTGRLIVTVARGGPYLPNAVLAVYPANHSRGLEFVYPKAQQMSLQADSEPIVAFEANSAVSILPGQILIAVKGAPVCNTYPFQDRCSG